MSLPAWMSRMNAACFAASLDFEDSLVALSSGKQHQPAITSIKEFYFKCLSHQL
jgi:hypothetical protein